MASCAYNGGMNIKCNAQHPVRAEYCVLPEGHGEPGYVGPGGTMHRDSFGFVFEKAREVIDEDDDLDDFYGSYNPTTGQWDPIF